LALIAKVNVSMISYKTTSLNLSIWIRLVDLVGESFKLQYSIVAVPIVILLSISIVLPTIFTIIGLTKIPYKN
jgi:hypothetical protein